MLNSLQQFKNGIIEQEVVVRGFLLVGIEKEALCSAMKWNGKKNNVLRCVWIPTYKKYDNFKCWQCLKFSDCVGWAWSLN